MRMRIQVGLPIPLLATWVLYYSKSGELQNCVDIAHWNQCEIGWNQTLLYTVTYSVVYIYSFSYLQLVVTLTQATAVITRLHWLSKIWLFNEIIVILELANSVTSKASVRINIHPRAQHVCEYKDTETSTISSKHLHQRDQQLLEAELKMLVMDLEIQGSSRSVEV